MSDQYAARLSVGHRSRPPWRTRFLCQLSSLTRPGAPAGSTPAMCANACQAIVSHLRGCHNRPPAGCHAECHRCFPPCPRRRRPPLHRPTVRGQRTVRLRRSRRLGTRPGTFPVSTPSAGPLAHSAVCIPAPAQALASLGVSVYDPTCPCAGACLRCPWRHPTRVSWPLHSRPGAKPAVRPRFAPPTFDGRCVGQNNPPAVCPARRPLHASAHAE